MHYFEWVLLAEVFAVLAEAAYLKELQVRRPLLWAFVANLSSVTLGFACRSLFGWP